MTAFLVYDKRSKRISGIGSEEPNYKESLWEWDKTTCYLITPVSEEDLSLLTEWFLNDTHSITLQYLNRFQKLQDVYEFIDGELRKVE